MKILHLSRFAGLIALALLSNSNVAHAQDFRNCDCAWPIELSPEGYGNATGPESLARYFLIPFDTQYDTMTIKGTYPNARYFSFVAYQYQAETPIEVVGDLYDAQIAPDPGSVNPFVRPKRRIRGTQATNRPVNGTYAVVISRKDSSFGNTIGIPGGSFVWVMLRIYIPSADPSLSGQSLIGGVALPTVLLTTRDGGSRELSPCSQVNDLQDISALFHDLFGDVALENREDMPSSDRLWFAPPIKPPTALLPNPHIKYIAMLPGDHYQPGRIIVIHGKAPGTPDTYDGLPIWKPARGFRTVDMRYWSLCNVNLALPITSVDCTADLTTNLQGGDYTIVISDDLLRPDWLEPNINWLRWGDEHYHKLIFFRNMLSSSDFPFSVQNAIKKEGCTFKFELPVIPDSDATIGAGQCTSQVMGDYYPVALWCDKSTFVDGGWRACIDDGQ